MQLHLTRILVQDDATQRILHRHGCIGQLLDDERTRLVHTIVTDAVELRHWQPLGYITIGARQAHDVHGVTQAGVELGDALGLDAKLLDDVTRKR